MAGQDDTLPYQLCVEGLLSTAKVKELVARYVCFFVLDSSFLNPSKLGSGNLFVAVSMKVSVACILFYIFHIFQH